MLCARQFCLSKQRAVNSNADKSRRKRGGEHYLRLALLASILGTAINVAVVSHADLQNEAFYETKNIVFRSLIASSIICSILVVLKVTWKRMQRAGRWFFTWRILKRMTWGLAVVLSLIVGFYIEEDIRGWRAWEACRRKCEASGQHLDFAHFIPALVPDDQNFAMAPVVASTWEGFLDSYGQVLQPPDTNVTDRLYLSLDRPAVPGTTNLSFQRFRTGQFIDLDAWQQYFRTMSVTNPAEEWVGPGSPTPIHVKIVALMTNEFPMASQAQTPGEDVLLALSKYGPVLDELRQASRLPYARFPLNYQDDLPYDIIFPHLRAVFACCKVLDLRAASELRCGRVEEALEDVQLMIYLSGTLRNEAWIVTSQSRPNSLRYCLQPIWEGLASKRWSADQLQKLENELSQFDAVSEYDNGIQAQLAARLKEIDYLRLRRNSWEEWFSSICEADSLSWPGLEYRFMPTGWFYDCQLRAVRVASAARPTRTEQAQRILRPDIYQRSVDCWNSESRHFRGAPAVVFGFIMPSEIGTVANWAETQAYVDMARIACALERYYLTHQRYPETLNQLAPDLIDQIPHDIVTGQPLHYAQSKNGRYILYSVGWNEKDDGGVPESPWPPFAPEDARKPGDWVWRYPEL